MSLTDIGALLEEAAQSGRLDGITIYPSPNWGWQVSVKTKGNDGWNCEMGQDLNALLSYSLSRFNEQYKLPPGVKHLAAEPTTQGGVFD